MRLSGSGLIRAVWSEIRNEIPEELMSHLFHLPVLYPPRGKELGYYISLL